MNRVIKFRCWNTKTNAWAYGYETLGGFNLFGELNLLGEVRLEDLNDLEVMQFTGLLDKNGKEIYEGDILACKFHPAYVERVSWKGPPDAICQVVWDYAGFGLIAQGEKDRRYPPLYEIVHMENDETEVIGNIYENSDLLV